MSDLRLGRNWDRQLEDNLPDCRVSYGERDRTVFMRGRMAMEMVFCAQCHQPKGAVTADWTAFVFFICDECVGRCQTKPEGAQEIPEAVVQGRSPVISR